MDDDGTSHYVFANANIKSQLDQFEIYAKTTNNDTYMRKNQINEFSVLTSGFTITDTHKGNELLFESNNNELTKIKLFNSNGAIVKELNHFSIVGENSINISTNNLSKGFYILNIENKNYFTKLKLIKL